MTRLADDRFLIVTGTAFGRHDLSWIEPRHGPTTGTVTVRDVTSSMACFGLWGPAAPRHPRRRLRRRPRLPLHERSAASPSATCRAWALRVTYVGELGWELYPPTEYGLRLWDTLVEAGRPTGWSRRATAPSTRSGWRRATGSGARDITSETDPYAAGLGFAVRLEKGEFLGRDAAGALRPTAARERLCCLVLDDPRSVALGNEPVKDGDVVGRVSRRRARLLARRCRSRTRGCRPSWPSRARG